MTSSTVDVLILGAGPAGLSAALGVARQLHTAIVFDSGQYRNSASTLMHNLPGYDHYPPHKFRAEARDQVLNRYTTVQFEQVEIVHVKKLPNNTFSVMDSVGQEYCGKKLILATGVKDIMPDLPGFKDLWGTRIFHCLSCNGYEERTTESVGILATGQIAHVAILPNVCRMANRLSGIVNIYFDGNDDLAAQLRPVLNRTKTYRFETRKVVSLQRASSDPQLTSVLVTLEDGNSIEEAFMVHTPEMQQSSTAASELGLALTAQGYLDVAAPFNSTSVSGVFAAGDCATVLKSIPNAIAMGALAAVGAGYMIQQELDAEGQINQD